MAATTKEQPSPIEKSNSNTKNAEYIKCCKKSYFPGQFDNKSSQTQSKYRTSTFSAFGNFCGGDNYESKERNFEKESTNNQQEKRKRMETDGKDVPLMKYDQKINIGYTPFTLFVHLTIIFQHLYTLYPMPFTSTHITSFTQLVYITTTCFHIATLLANLFKKCQVEKVFVLYGTWVIWSGWAMCLWLINSENRSDPLLPKGYYYVNGNESIVLPNVEALIKPMDATPLMHGKWTSALPILSFFLLLAIRRNHWGLLTWEHLVVLETTNSLKYYRTWCIAGAGAGWILFWEAVKFWCHVFAHVNPVENNVIYHTDSTRLPGLFNILLVSFASGIFMICWWSFWTFQYKGVVWKKELREGVVVWSSDGLIQVGGVC
ncbi:9334_t:CDS:2 [Acaulospora morrowiae]|uniref:9334_t:CDS:1 n=1 Tax=Acaulospora morrowiae TaxID=94023 RepID=A0A9N9ELW1_9GLOM|nr:9334_t:CDS:2 [Acaulospora morrowiae]